MFHPSFIHHGAAETTEDLDFFVHRETTMDKNNLLSKNTTRLLPQAALGSFVCPEFSRDKRKEESTQCTL
jgi:hypothetical protein